MRRRGRAHPLPDLFVEGREGLVGSPPGLRVKLVQKVTEPPDGHVLVQEESRQDLPQVVSRIWEEDEEARETTRQSKKKIKKKNESTGLTKTTSGENLPRHPEQKYQTFIGRPLLFVMSDHTYGRCLYCTIFDAKSL